MSHRRRQNNRAFGDRVMDAKTRRKITQQTGAIVSESGEIGEVVGHYDDDSVYVQFEGKSHPERVWTEALTLVQPEPFKGVSDSKD
jgi:hypothetical protein